MDQFIYTLLWVIFCEAFVFIIVPCLGGVFTIHMDGETIDRYKESLLMGLLLLASIVMVVILIIVIALILIGFHYLLTLPGV